MVGITVPLYLLVSGISNLILTVREDDLAPRLFERTRDTIDVLLSLWLLSGFIFRYNIYIGLLGYYKIEMVAWTMIPKIEH